MYHIWAVYVFKNQNLIILLYSNMGIVTITKWSLNLILTTKMIFKKWVFRCFWA